MKKKKHPVFTTDNHPKGKMKTPGLVEEKKPKEQSPPQESAPPRSIEDAETEEEELDQNDQNQRRAQTK